MEIKLKLKNLENDEIGERVCGFARNMNGVENAEFDSEKRLLSITLSQSGSESVVVGAVTGLLGTMDKNIIVTQNDDEEAAEPKKANSKVKALCRLAVILLLAAFGVVSAGSGKETVSLFSFIAAYIIAGRDAFMLIFGGIRRERRVRIAEIAVCAVSAALFLCGMYLFALAVMVLYRIFRDFLAKDR